MAKPIGARVRFRAIGGLIDRLAPPHDRTLAVVADALDLAREYRHDYRLSKVGRLSPAVGAAFAYEAPNGATARSHGLSADLLGHLGYPEAATEPDVVMSDVFTVRLGSDTVWGNAETGCFVLLAHPRTVYR